MSQDQKQVKPTPIRAIVIAFVLLILFGSLVFLISKQIRPTSSVKEEQSATVTGTLTYRERIALPSGSEVIISLQDVSRADAAADLIAEQKITTQGENVPIKYSLNYDPQIIIPQHTYSVSAKIMVDKKLAWITDTSYPVITDPNSTTNQDLILVQVSQ